MAVGAVVARILTQYSDKGSKAAQKDIKKFGKDIDAFSKKVTKAFAVAAAASAAFAIKVGKDAVKAAVEDAKSQAVLANTLRNTLGATDANIAAVEAYIEKQQMLTNVQDTELRASFSALAVALGNTNDAMLVQGVALDVAAGTGKDLSAVTDAITKATQGNFTALKKLVPTLDASIVKNKDLGKALTYLSTTYKGSAKELAKSDPITSLQIAFSELSEKLGVVLLPTFIKFADFIKTRVIPELEYYLFLNEERLVNAFESVFRGLKDLANTFQQIYNVIGAINSLIPLGLGTWIKLGVAISVAGNAAVLFMTAAKKYKELKTMYTMVRGSEQGFKLLRAELGRSTTAAEFLGGKLATLRNYIVASTPGAFVIAQFTAFKNMLLASAAAGNKLAAAILLIGNRLKAISVWLLRTPWGRLLLAATAIAGIVAKLSGDKKITLDEQARKAEFSMYMAAKSTESMDDAVNKYRETQSKVVAKTKEQIAEEKRLAALRAKADADAKKRAKFEADYAKLNATLAARAGVKLLSSEDEKMVQINAAIALADRQKQINALDKERLERMKEELISMKVRNDLAKRYQDILTALADQKIDPKEIIILAKMWGVPTEAVEAYLATIFAVEDATITDDEIVNLAMKWGSTQAQAAQYLDFFQALNDGQLSDAEINKLMAKWKLTQDEVLLYADFVGIVNDGKLEDAEIIKIQGKWKLTVDQVVDYIKKIGAPVSYSGTLIDPARAAEIGWLNAAAALQRYLDLLKAGTGVVVPKNVPGGFIPGSGEDPAVIAAAAAAQAAADKAAADAAAALAESEAALAAIAAAERASAARNYAIAKATGDMDTAAIFAAQVGPSALAAGESGAIGAASIAAALKAAEQQLQNERIMSTYASFQAKERADAAAAAATSSYGSNSAADESERARMRAMLGSTVATATGISGGNLMAAPVVNITVQGSVTSEQDLVQTVRNGLLATQYNGNQITLQAI